MQGACVRELVNKASSIFCRLKGVCEFSRDKECNNYISEMEESNTSLIHQLLFSYMLKVSHLRGNISVLPSGAVELCVFVCFDGCECGRIYEHVYVCM